MRPPQSINNWKLGVINQVANRRQALCPPLIASGQKRAVLLLMQLIDESSVWHLEAY
jgi:hypothetical protein